MSWWCFFQAQPRIVYILVLHCVEVAVALGLMFIGGSSSQGAAASGLWNALAWATVLSLSTAAALTSVEEDGKKRIVRTVVQSEMLGTRALIANLVILGPPYVLQKDIKEAIPSMFSGPASGSLDRNALTAVSMPDPLLSGADTPVPSGPLSRGESVASDDSDWHKGAAAIDCNGPAVTLTEPYKSPKHQSLHPIRKSHSFASMLRPSLAPVSEVNEMSFHAGSSIAQRIGARGRKETEILTEGSAFGSPAFGSPSELYRIKEDADHSQDDQSSSSKLIIAKAADSSCESCRWLAKLLSEGSLPPAGSFHPPKRSHSSVSRLAGMTSGGSQTLGISLAGIDLVLGSESDASGPHRTAVLTEAAAEAAAAAAVERRRPSPERMRSASLVGMLRNAPAVDRGLVPALDRNLVSLKSIGRRQKLVRLTLSVAPPPALSDAVILDDQQPADNQQPWVSVVISVLATDLRSALSHASVSVSSSVDRMERLSLNPSDRVSVSSLSRTLSPTLTKEDFPRVSSSNNLQEPAGKQLQRIRLGGQSGESEASTADSLEEELKRRAEWGRRDANEAAGGNSRQPKGQPSFAFSSPQQGLLAGQQSQQSSTPFKAPMVPPMVVGRLSPDASASSSGVLTTGAVNLATWAAETAAAEVPYSFESSTSDCPSIPEDAEVDASKRTVSFARVIDALNP